MYDILRQLKIRTRLLAVIAAAALPVAGASAQKSARAHPGENAPANFSSAITAAQDDLRRALDELQRVQTQIADKRIPLARELSEQESRVRELRTQADRLRIQRSQTEAGRRTLDENVQKLDEECRFIHALFSEYRRSVASRAGVAGALFLNPHLAAADRHLAGRNEYAGLPAAADTLLQLASRWNLQRIGGMTFDGPCLDESGKEHAGRFPFFGPQAYFAASERAGIVVVQLGSSMPSLFAALTSDEKAAIAALVSGREAPVPVDVTSGAALKIAEAREPWMEHIRKGGFVMVPILLIAVIGAAITLIKFFELRRLDVRQSAAADRVISLTRQNDISGALSAAREIPSPLGSVIQEAIEYHDASQEQVEEIMHERMMAYVPRLERFLGSLAVLGGVAPLLGLLGTVTGMIHTFQLVKIFGSGDPQLLSSGISEALITTQYGLYVAIPVLLIHAYLSRRVRTMIGALESTIVTLVNQLKIRRQEP